MRTRQILQANTVLPIVGTKFHPESVRDLQNGATVQIVAEPTNEHDRNAMMVIDTQSRTLGYLPKDLAYRISTEMGGAPLVARVEQVTMHDGEKVGARIRIQAILDIAA